MAEEYVLTQSGYDKIKEEYDYIISERRPQNIQRIKEARELGDLSENFDYQDAKREQGEIEGRLADLKFILENAKVMVGSEDGSIGLGSNVTILYDGDDEDEAEEITIVGQAESDPIEGKISLSSPLGNALMGKKAGDDVSYEAPSRIVKLKILSVS
ncbi:MAG: transcription elongation factor GreA [Armatimonadetes bacterium]|nr:transcription elongation factor GreA [Candidatus Hippobium faecium]